MADDPTVIPTDPELAPSRPAEPDRRRTRLVSEPVGPGAPKLTSWLSSPWAGCSAPRPGMGSPVGYRRGLAGFHGRRSGRTCRAASCSACSWCSSSNASLRPGSSTVPRDRCPRRVHDHVHLPGRDGSTDQGRPRDDGTGIRAGEHRRRTNPCLRRDLGRTSHPRSVLGGWSMKLEGLQQRLTIYIGESDRHGHTPLATEIVQRAHGAGLAGASVFRGVEGYGASNHIHTTRILSLSDDLPIAIVIIDRPAAIAEFLPNSTSSSPKDSSSLDEVEVVKYVGRNTPS